MKTLDCLEILGACLSRPPVLASGQKCALRLILSFVFTGLIALDASAQIQQAWVARYNHGITNGVNQAVAMSLDAAGNIYVGGYSVYSNGFSNLGYVALKYAPNGAQVYAARYDTLAPPYQEMATAMAVDGSNNVIMTGNAGMIKFDSNGNPLWTAPYAGTTLAVDGNANIYVGGFSTNFGVVKLSPQGSNVWLRTYVESYGPTVSQSVLVDNGNNVYVSGLDTYNAFYNNGTLYGPYVQLTTIKYDSNGSRLWLGSTAPFDSLGGVKIGGAALDSATNIYLVSNWFYIGGESAEGYITYKYTTDGALLWTTYAGDGNEFNRAYGLVLDNSNNVIIAGQLFHSPQSNGIGTIELSTNGATKWTGLYPPAYTGMGAGLAIAVDSANNSYVTGFALGPNSTNEIITLKYDPNGNQKWLQRYTGPAGPANGYAQGNAIAVDNNGNVYVTGYEYTAAGGTEIVTIKSLSSV